MVIEDKKNFFSIKRDIVYAVEDGIELMGDLYLPDGIGHFPVIVAVPGGGWFFSDKLALKLWGGFFAQNGIALFAASYRVSSREKGFPKPICDTLSAIQFIRGSAGALNIDPERIALLGPSAGAHVAALAALAGDSPLFANRHPVAVPASTSTKVLAFAGIYGVYDLFSLWQQEISEACEAHMRHTEVFMGASPYADRQLYFDASPVSYVNYTNNKLPVFLAYGAADKVVQPAMQSEALAKLLKQAGFRVREYQFSDAGHFWFSEETIGDTYATVTKLAPDLLRFMKKILLP